MFFFLQECGFFRADNIKNREKKLTYFFSLFTPPSSLKGHALHHGLLRLPLREAR